MLATSRSCWSIGRSLTWRTVPSTTARASAQRGGVGFRLAAAMDDGPRPAAGLVARAVGRRHQLVLLAALEFGLALLPGAGRIGRRRRRRFEHLDARAASNTS